MRRASILAIAITTTAAACAGDADTADNANGGDSSDPETLVRSTGAAAETIALSAELSRLATAPSFAAGDCAATEIDQGRVEVTLGDCGGVTGSMVITFDDPACMDPTAGCDELAVSVDVELEIDGLRITGRFDNRLSEDGYAAAGELTIAGAGLDLAIAFDLSVADDGTCATIDGTFEIDGDTGPVSVEAAGLVDCGGLCPESGVLSARAGDREVTIDFGADNACSF